jgi:hypothetical protein
MAEQEGTPSTGGSRDGTGAGDHDRPYHFGHKSTSACPHPFSGVEFARLLIVRGRAGQRKSMPMPHKVSDSEHLLSAATLRIGNAGRATRSSSIRT